MNPSLFHPSCRFAQNGRNLGAGHRSALLARRQTRSRCRATSPRLPPLRSGRGGRLSHAAPLFLAASHPKKWGPRRDKSERQHRRPRPIRRAPERWVKRLFVSPKIEPPGWSTIIWQASADQLDAADRPISFRHPGGGCRVSHPARLPAWRRRFVGFLKRAAPANRAAVCGAEGVLRAVW